ncbi:magnesium chelatase ATPase subunit I [Polynucleobacter kasalickyi]|uniref:Mg-protoporphyrin IX chelatase n=1 Tax=Polynucleobacter kasalickyi TaxID=1938817 RepID=A0A1W1Z0E0_9BURK|nr:magnesium chelatase ATPase subunit I [Polynucleobacter kasalickyi]SMC41856.1 protoporphyrin IX magnesium-chelatase [Polynucleobacter kasalickyi]
MSFSFPFSAIVGQDEMKLALILSTIDPNIGGVLMLGDRGTGKSTVVRSLAALLPPIKAVSLCKYHCDPALSVLCSECEDKKRNGIKLKVDVINTPVVDLPLGSTEDRVVGSIDLEKALSQGVKSFEPGLLAKANRGFLYIDEVNLLEDHLVDLLIDVAASGENVVERDGLSVKHPAKFVLIGSGNPEEGELRPQLLDRYGMSVEVRTPTDVLQRIEIIKRREAFERDREQFIAKWAEQDLEIQKHIVQSKKRLERVEISDELLIKASTLCAHLGADGLRGELTMMRTMRALAAYQGKKHADIQHLKAVAPLALRHRLRRDPLDDTGSSARVERAIEEIIQ